MYSPRPRCSQSPFKQDMRAAGRLCTCADAPSQQHVVNLGRQSPSVAWRGLMLRRPRTQSRASSRDDAASPSAASGSGSSFDNVIFLPSGDVVSMASRRRCNELWPELVYSREEALQKQLSAMKDNNSPYVDHGVEVMYRWADIDPFDVRTTYFGRLFDLGQFERFRRIMHTPPYVTLLGHQSATVVSSLEVCDRMWVARVAVTGSPRGEKPGDEAVYEFTLTQRLGGVHDGYWYTHSLVADGNDWSFMRGPRTGQAV